MKAVIEIKNAAFTYSEESSPVWEGLSCTFYESKIHAIVGKSGCGKSSFLHYINGIVPFLNEGEAKGSIEYRGKDISKLEPNKRFKNIGLVMQDPDSQFCCFTVEEEIAFGMENLSYDFKTMDERIDEILDFMGIAHLRYRLINSLSGGQKQKLAIAASLVTEPDVLLLDEPTANLDPQSRKEVFDIIQRLADEKNVTVIIVEHNIHEMIEKLDFIYYMENNSIREISSEDMKNLIEKDTYKERTYNHSSEKTIIDVQNLTFGYQSEENLFENASFEIKEGDFISLIGNNGCGKSTLVKLIFGILNGYSGDIFFDGNNIKNTNKTFLFKNMGLVFQNPENQFISNSIEKEMLMSLKLEDFSVDEQQEKIDAMLKRFDMHKIKDRSPFLLSQGQKRRLSVALMLLTNQKVLFLDEPTYGQDFKNRRRLMEDLLKLNMEGVTIVMITHDLDIVRAFSNKVLKIDNKKISYIPKDRV